MNLRSVGLAAVLAIAVSGSAMAADLVIYDEPSMMSPSSAFDWDGFYIGGSLGVWNEGSMYPSVGILAGVNYAMDSFLFGLEGSLDYYWTSPEVAIEAIARAGFVLDNVVLDGHVGIGALLGDSPYGIVGVGAEFGLMENVSIAGSLDGLVYSGGIGAVRGELSLRYHF
jgi:opacity protein-like surface antigen